MSRGRGQGPHGRLADGRGAGNLALDACCGLRALRREIDGGWGVPWRAQGSHGRLLTRAARWRVRSGIRRLSNAAGSEHRANRGGRRALTTAC